MSLADIKARIASAAKEAGRDPASIRLLAASKAQLSEDIRRIILQGQTVFGENRVQEAAEKWPQLKKEFPAVQLHMIGHLQSNKAREAVALFDVIETVDSEKLADELSKEMKKQGRNLPCFIQVNTGDEEQKGGVSPKDVPALFDFCKAHGLNITGLMCIPPVHETPELHFALLADLAKRLKLANLSMGMSSDFETAIRFGASHIRIGTALFGTRIK